MTQVPLYPRSQFLIIGRRDKWLWFLIASQSACWPPGSQAPQTLASSLNLPAQERPSSWFSSLPLLLSPSLLSSLSPVYWPHAVYYFLSLFWTLPDASDCSLTSTIKTLTISWSGHISNFFTVLWERWKLCMSSTIRICSHQGWPSAVAAECQICQQQRLTLSL